MYKYVLLRRVPIKQYIVKLVCYENVIVTYFGKNKNNNNKIIYYSTFTHYEKKY